MIKSLEVVNNTNKRLSTMGDGFLCGESLSIMRKARYFKFVCWPYKINEVYLS